MAEPSAGVDRLLDAARERIGHRPVSADLPTIASAGGLVVDIRPQSLRDRDGEMPGAVVIERNVLEWRLDPTSPHRIEQAGDPDQVIVLVCDEGYASSLAAAVLHDLGLHRATDLDGGYQAWLRHRAAGSDAVRR